MSILGKVKLILVFTIVLFGIAATAQYTSKVTLDKALTEKLEKIKNY